MDDLTTRVDANKLAIHELSPDGLIEDFFTTNDMEIDFNDFGEVFLIDPFCVEGPAVLVF